MHRLVSLICVLVGLSIAPAALAAPGDLDPTFSVDGLVRGGAINHAQSVAVDGSGAVVIVGGTPVLGDPVVIRYLPDGTLDHGFGVGGVATLDLGATASAQEVAIDPGGRIVGAGGFDGDLFVFRLRGDGALDSSFGGGDGVVRIDFGGSNLGGLALQDDGRLVVAGVGFDGATDGIALARLGPDGTLDDTFSGDGKLLFDPGGDGPTGSVGGITVDTGGSILVAAGWPGSYQLAASGEDAVVIAIEPDGDPDPDFGDGGVSRLEFGSADAAHDLELLPDGRIVFIGDRCSGGLHYTCEDLVGRLRADGGLDPSFDGDGWRVLGVRTVDTLALQEDARIVLGGTTGDFAIRRLEQTGEPDPGFSGDGLVTTDFAFTTDWVRDLAFSPDGRIVAAGLSGHGKHAIARYLVSDGPADADADATLDPSDRCPLRFSKRPSGCPRPSGGRLSLRAEPRLPTTELGGRIRGANRGCVADRTIGLFRAREAGRRRVGRTETDYDGRYRDFRSDRTLGPGIYFAIAKRLFDADVGVCKRVESKPYRVRGA